ncbi:hypothetical protein CAter282_2282 [Collimonas arenae]|uniref:Uncharacterized protein n=1 Tax=Collimonas arenae TaxID=279058 RepID=A0A127QKC3_9BURK|nr:hypothetical protein CAter282_2282 [Collimonas arenae]
MPHLDESSIAPLQLNKSILSSMEEYGTGYVMYPAMKCFSTRFGVDDFLEAATHRRNIGPRYGLSLSLHMPPAASNFQPVPALPVSIAIAWIFILLI